MDCTHPGLRLSNETPQGATRSLAILRCTQCQTAIGVIDSDPPILANRILDALAANGIKPAPKFS